MSYISDKNINYIIFDIGSRDCLQSIEFYNNFPNAHIYAFECNPNTINICKKNIENYNNRITRAQLAEDSISYPQRITLIEGAVCDYDGEITFYPINQQKTITSWDDGNPGASSLYKSNRDYPYEKYVQDEVITNCHRLDTIMNKYNIKNVDIIWMDLQGAELLALKGLGKYLKDVKYIYTEITHKEIYKGQVLFEEFNQFMINNNFKLKNNLLMTEWQEDAIYEKINDNIYDLTTYYNNIYSQRGSDGILEKIMKELNINNGFFIEFGAWDGIYLSNTRILFNKGWSGCYIEGDSNKFKQLVKNYENTNIICINEYIYPTNDEGTTLDDIYNKYIIDKEIELLSIDIDGRDYEIFENLKIKPKIIIIEGGFSWHPCLRTKIPYDIAKDNLQQPLFITIKLGKSKGYQPIVFNQDLFLLRDDLYYKYEFFQYIKNDHYNLWLAAFKNILDNNDRLWLEDFRFNNSNINLFENKYYLNLLHSLENIFDIVILLGPKDINIIKKQIEYTKKNIIGYRYIYIISYDDSIILEDCITISESIFPFSLETVSKFHGKLERNGWYLQQLLKLYAGLVIPNILDKYLVIDSDTFFIKPIFFIENKKCLYNYSFEYNKPYFIHMKKLHPEFTKFNENISGICHHMIFETKYIKELINMVQIYHNNEYFYNIFLQNVTENDYELYGASEYEIYFNYILYKHSNDINLRLLNWKNSNNFEELNSDNDYISYHWYINF